MIRDDNDHFFRRIIDRRRPARSLGRTIVLLAVIIWFIYYLMKIAGTG